MTMSLFSPTALTLTSTLLAGFLLLVVCLFKFRNPLQFYIKFGVYMAVTILYSTLFLPVFLFRPNSTKNISTAARHLSFLFRIFQLELKAEGTKYLKIQQPFVLISNHQSSLDFFTMMNIWPQGANLTPLAKQELLWSGPFGLAIWLAGITFVDRLNPGKSRGTMNKLAQRVTDEQMAVWIYPEGTRSPGTNLKPFKKGAFHLAIAAQVPIVCLVTSSYSNFYCKKEKKWIPHGQIRSRVLPPFQTKGMSGDQVNQLTKHLQDTMQKEFDDLNKQVGLEKKYYTTATTPQKEDLKDRKVDEIRDTHRSEAEQIVKKEDGEENVSVLGEPSLMMSSFGSDDNNNSLILEDITKDKKTELLKN